MPHKYLQLQYVIICRRSEIARFQRPHHARPQVVYGIAFSMRPQRREKREHNASFIGCEAVQCRTLCKVSGKSKVRSSRTFSAGTDMCGGGEHSCRVARSFKYNVLRIYSWNYCTFTRERELKAQRFSELLILSAFIVPSIMSNQYLTQTIPVACHFKA